MDRPHYILRLDALRRNSWWGRKPRHPRVLAARLLFVTLGGLGAVLALALIFHGQV